MVKVYQSIEDSRIWKKKCKSTVVLVDNANITHRGMINLWKENGKKIIEEWHPLVDECDDILFVKNDIGHAKHSSDKDYWIADEAICLNGILGGCIAWEDRLFYIGIRDSTLRSDIIDSVNGKPIELRFIDN
ncbi:hypothetical protein C9426_24650 [Serratia sp. S1B]|nr:hypothetical protein C9426_24650 [Serratia sp. S1B]